MSTPLHEQLRQLQKQAKLTQQELANAIGVKRPTVTQIEGGKATTTEVIERWVVVCGGTISIGLSQVSPEDPMVEILQKLHVADRARVLALASQMPLDNADARTLDLLLAGWSKVSLSEERQENVKTG